VAAHFRRELCPGDQRPVVVQPEWHHRLIDVEDVLGRPVRTIPDIRFIAQRQGDVAGYRILSFLGQFGVADRRT
jgi:hypothetical protein